ncbi:MAG: hypothetical protein K8R21_15260 [Leptospira sp.]|nr:hypothetical protein [Leptospira sp.]
MMIQITANCIGSSNPGEGKGVAGLVIAGLLSKPGTSSDSGATTDNGGANPNVQTATSDSLTVSVNGEEAKITNESLSITPASVSDTNYDGVYSTIKISESKRIDVKLRTLDFNGIITFTNKVFPLADIINSTPEYKSANSIIYVEDDISYKNTDPCSGNLSFDDEKSVLSISLDNCNFLRLDGTDSANVKKISLNFKIKYDESAAVSKIQKGSAGLQGKVVSQEIRMESWLSRALYQAASHVDIQCDVACWCAITHACGKPAANSCPLTSQGYGEVDGSTCHPRPDGSKDCKYCEVFKDCNGAKKYDKCTPTIELSYQASWHDVDPATCGWISPGEWKKYFQIPVNCYIPGSEYRCVCFE